MAEKDVTLFQLENVEPTQKIVGLGAYGRVIEVTTRSAAKELHQVLTNFASPQELARLQQKFLTECHQCSQLCHPNIVQFLGIYYPSEDAKLPWLVMEKMDCSLTEYLRLHKPNEVSFQTRISTLHDVTLGLQYLHIQDIIHRDLSSNNILLTKQLVAKIADLGVAKVIDPNRTKSHSQAPGTIIFMPPEALLVRPRYGKPVDVFSLGCVMIHTMTHIWPVPKDEVSVDEVTGKKTARGEIERREDYLELIQRPEQLKELIKKCLNDLPEQRPSISDVSKVFRELKPDLKLGKMYSILFEYEPLLLQKSVLEKNVKDLEKKLEEEVNQLSKQLEDEKQVKKDMEEHFIVQEDTISKLESNARQNEENANNATAALEQEKELLIQSNHMLSREVARLMSVDVELQNSKKEIEKYQLELRKAEEEMLCKEFMLNTYKEDVLQERKDREKAHYIKEEEIEKIRIEREELIANHDEDIKRIQENYQTQLNTYSRKIRPVFSGPVTNNTKLSQENARLLAVLEKQNKELQNKADLYKIKTEQFQAQWRKREEAEKMLKDLTDQLSAQRHLNADQQNTIDDLLRKRQDQRQTSHENSSNYPPSMGLKYPPQKHDATVANADMSKYYHHQQHQQQELYYQQQLCQQEQTWQQERQQQHQYQMNQQPQNNLYLREQGRGMFHNQPVRPGGDVYPGGSNYPQKYLLPTRDHLGGQPMSLGRVNVAQRDYGTAGTNAAPQHDTPRMDDTYHNRLNNAPMSWDNFQSKNPAPLSEGINEEIRIQADLQRRQQQQDEFESTLAYDPYLICHKCNCQFREGQLPEYRHHIDNCRH